VANLKQYGVGGDSLLVTGIKFKFKKEFELY